MAVKPHALKAVRFRRVHWKRAAWAYVLLLPALTWLAAMVLVPSLKAVLDSFTNLSIGQTGSPQWTGLDNFVQLWRDPKFWSALQHSLVLTALAVPLEVVLGLGVGLALRRPLPGIAACRALLLVGWVISTVSQVIIFERVFGPGDGHVNQWLRAMGLSGWARNWFQDPQFAFGMVVGLHVWRNAPFFAVNLLAGMLAIPKGLYESARLDGASAWKLLLHVTLPQLRWIILTLVVGHVIFTFTDYTLVAVSTGGGPVDVTEVLPLYLYNLAWEHHQLGQASAVGLVMFSVLVLFTLVLIRLQWRGQR